MEQITIESSEPYTVELHTSVKGIVTWDIKVKSKDKDLAMAEATALHDTMQKMYEAHNQPLRAKDK